MPCRARLTSGLPLAVALFVAGAADAGDWPQWRGPERNGLVEKSPTLANSLPGPTPAWQSESIPSGDRAGRGSLVVFAGKVYGLTGVGSASGLVDEVFCLDAATGKTIWRSR